MFTDLRQAFRTLLKSPGFSALVVVVLALGIGANTAIFSIVNGVLLKTLPFPDASRLVTVVPSVRGEEDDSLSFPDVQDFRAQAKSLDKLAAHASSGMTLLRPGGAVELQTTVTTADLFPMLGATPLLGRTLTEADDAKGAELVAVISEGAWDHYFARRPGIVGEAITFDSTKVTIVGVMPASFQYPIQAEKTEIWLPFRGVKLLAQWMEQRGAHYVHAVGRLRPGATIEQANAELATINERLATDFPNSNKNRTATVEPLQERLVADYELGLVVLLCAVAAVLLIACANVANLLLARATTRHREMAIRAAIGAPRSRLIRQLLTESSLLAVGGGGLGALLALWAIPALIGASPLEIPRLQDVGVDRTVLAFTMLVSMATGVLFGLAPALQLSRADGGDALKSGERLAGNRGTTRVRQVLVVAEVALSLVLLASAGLLIRSLVALEHVDPGFVADHALTVSIAVPDNRYPDAKAQIGLYDALLGDLQSVPGAASSAISTTLPMSGSNLGVGFQIEGRPQPPGQRDSAGYFAVSPDYFHAMGIRLVKGRAFTPRDRETTPLVMVISEAMAKKYWPNQDAIGQRIAIGYNKTGPREIVGIVSDVKQGDLSEKTQPSMYAPFPQTPWPFFSVVVRTTGDPASVSNSLRAAISARDPNQAVSKIETVTSYISNSVATPRFTAALVGAFAALALLLAGFGLFGVMAYSVAQRRREIGIRMALGAQATDVRALVVGQALRLGGIGLAVGLAGAFAATRVLDTLLFGVQATDPLTFGGVCLLLAGVLVAAAYLPARRATRVDPVVALRTE